MKKKLTVSGDYLLTFVNQSIMNFTEEIINVGKEKATRIQSFLEEIEVQMALGKAEARDSFEKEKKNFNKFLHSYKDQVREAENIATNHRLELNDKFNDLEAMISKEFPTAKRTFDKFKKDTLHAIYQLEFSLKEAYGDVGVLMQEKLDKFKDLLDAYRIQLALSDVEPEESLHTRKEELLKAVGEIREKLQKEEVLGTKIDTFVEDVSESFDKMKKAFSDLFA
jgi:hypothetical protein